jgi:hypothetical protein
MYRQAAALALAAAAISTAGCGQESSDAGNRPVIGRKGSDSQAASALGFPAFATKNTTRVGGGDPTADAAAVAQAVFSGELDAARPRAITLVDRSDWQAGVAASVFMNPMIRAPVLLTAGPALPQATREVLETLKPTGASKLGEAEVIRVGSVGAPRGMRAAQVASGNPFAMAVAIDQLQTKAAGKPSDRVIIASGERAEFAMPAAGWAAKSGDPVLYVTRDAIPPETRAALKFHQQPKIYLLGPPEVISAKTEKALQRLGTVKRIAGSDPVTNAIAFARFSDGTFGWDVVDPGHGIVVASSTRPLDAAAAAPLSASGKYGPLLLVNEGGKLPDSLVQFLLDIEPGYERDPVRGVYNHAWLLGDRNTISLSDQARIDTLLEIAPVSNQQSAAPPAAPAAPSKPSARSPAGKGREQPKPPARALPKKL